MVGFGRISASRNTLSGTGLLPVVPYSIPRRAVLSAAASALLLAVGGCLSSEGTENAAESADCDSEVTPEPNPTGTADLSPKSYPRLPDPLDRSSVTAFVEEFERAYTWNRILHEERDLTYVDVSRVRVADVTQADHADAGFVANATVEFGWGTGGDGETEMHADGGAKVSYVVADRRVERFESDDWEHPDPTATDGTALRCLPEAA